MFYGVLKIEDIFGGVEGICEILDGGSFAVPLILGTIAQETHMGTYRDRTEFNAGSGLCQIDEIGFRDIKERTKNRYKDKIYLKLGISIDKVTYEMLEYNYILSIIFCRLFYKMIPEKIPEDLKGQAHYWKKYYNTWAGKGTPEEYVENYNNWVKQ